MSNLASMIMEGANFGSVQLNHHYDHENGAGMIAMESAEALRDIFESVFYVPNTCEIKAALEGVSVEESSQASVMEASFKGAFEKIKQFFISLRDKVKDFLHNIKRYLTGIFGNDEKWIKTYEKELTALDKGALKDYEVKMYKYSEEVADMTKDGIEGEVSKITAKVESTMSQLKRDNIGSTKDETSDYDDQMEIMFKNFVKEKLGGSYDDDEIDKAIWSKMRSGADDAKDMEDVKVVGIMSNAIAALKASTKTLAAYDNLISKTDKAYNEAIKTVDKAAKEAGEAADKAGDSTSLKMEDGKFVGVPNSKLHGATAALLRSYSSTVSKMQSVENKIVNAKKSALVERNAAYKKALVGCFSYAKKNKGGK